MNILSLATFVGIVMSKPLLSSAQCTILIRLTVSTFATAVVVISMTIVHETLPESDTIFISPATCACTHAHVIPSTTNRRARKLTERNYATVWSLVAKTCNWLRRGMRLGGEKYWFFVYWGLISLFKKIGPFEKLCQIIESRPLKKKNPIPIIEIVYPFSSG